MKLLSSNQMNNSSITIIDKSESIITSAKEFSLIEKESNLILKLRIAHFLLSLFALNTICVLVIIFLVGFERMNLRTEIILSLIGETIAYAGAMFALITKYLFSKK